MYNRSYTGVSSTICVISKAHLQLSSIISHLVFNSKDISTGLQIAVNASQFVPVVCNGTLITVQIGYILKHWENVPVEQKLIIGLHLLSFIGASFRMVELTVDSIAKQAQAQSQGRIRETFAKNPETSVEMVEAFDKILLKHNPTGECNPKLMQFFRKVRNSLPLAAKP